MSVDHLMTGFVTALSPVNFLWMFAGLLVGIFMAAVPGIGAELGIVLAIPLTYNSPPEAVFLMMSAMYVGGMMGGAIASILLKIPGHPSAAATTLDGYPMAQQGKAGKALGMAVFSSSTGGLLSSLAMVVVTVPLVKVAVSFGPAEYFALAVLGLTVIASVAGKSLSKALIVTGIGLFLPTVGLDRITGAERFTFGIGPLMDGFHFAPILIGVFAVAEVFNKTGRKIEMIIADRRARASLPSLSEIREVGPTIIRSTVIGTVIGILPAVGGTVASFLGYSEAVRFSKNREKFGKGCLEGVAAPEAANNAAAPGSMVPTLALGIPGSGVTAIILGAFLLHGLEPGPLLFQKNPNLVATIFAGIILVNFLMLISGCWVSTLFSRVLDIPYEILAPIILVLSMVGAYTVRNNIMDVWITLIFGVVGYFMFRYEYPVVPLILALILGPMAELNFRRGLIVAHGSVFDMLTRPITAVLLAVAVMALVIPAFRSIRKSFSGRQGPAREFKQINPKGE